DGIVEIRACAREPGHRTKIAVWSNDNNVDPVGACVGARGARVRMVVNELKGEKIDIVPFSDDAADFVMKALSPARVKEVRIHEDTGTAEVIVPDYQLSLAIGKEGQNARLAARLTGWRVDIKSETQLAEEAAYQTDDWAQGEWIIDPQSGDQMWQPADGTPAMTAEEWSQLGVEQAEAETAEGETTDATADATVEPEAETAADATVAAEPEGDDPAADVTEDGPTAETVDEAPEPDAEDAVADGDEADAPADAVNAEEPAEGADEAVEAEDAAEADTSDVEATS
ncbi:MAG: transcription termination/antitermination protein NusA, partial [Acidimicrobiales bacterium]